MAIVAATTTITITVILPITNVAYATTVTTGYTTVIITVIYFNIKVTIIVYKIITFISTHVHHHHRSKGHLQRSANQHHCLQNSMTLVLKLIIIIMYFIIATILLIAVITIPTVRVPTRYAHRL